MYPLYPHFNKGMNLGSKQRETEDENHTKQPILKLICPLFCIVTDLEQKSINVIAKYVLDRLSMQQRQSSR